jgi:hypothetical protein
MNDDKRASPRFKISQAIEFSFAHEDFFTADAENIGKGGFAFKTNRPVNLHSVLFFLLDLPGPEGNVQIGVEGVCIHSEKTGDGKHTVGVRFTDFRPGDDDKLEEFLAWFEKEQASGQGNPANP